MPKNQYPTETPNVFVSNPHVRLVAGWILGFALIFFPAAIVLDVNAPGLDWSDWTTPGMAVTSFLAGVWGLTVTQPNIPK